MAGILNELGLFQFENLVKNRIPFLLLNLGTDLSGLFPPYHQTHLESQTLATTPEAALTELKNRKATKDQAIVVLCENGATSEKVIVELEAAGFMNTYFVKEGLQSLRGTITSSH